MQFGTGFASAEYIKVGSRLDGSLPSAQLSVSVRL